MGAVKINGTTSGSVSLEAPASGSDVTLTLPGVNGELLPLGGGKILQIVRATDSTQRSTTSTTYVDASISVTITPQKNNSAILLIWSAQVESPIGNLLTQVRITDASNNPISGAENGTIYDESATRMSIPVQVIGYATPATTAATTYKGQFQVNGGTGILANGSITGQLYAIEVSA